MEKCFVLEQFGDLKNDGYQFLGVFSTYEKGVQALESIKKTNLRSWLRNVVLYQTELDLLLGGGAQERREVMRARLVSL